MNKQFSCPQGHQWEVPVDGNLALAVEAISCPECGAAAETKVPESSLVDEKDPSQEATLSLVCPACRKKLKVKAKSAGKKVKCPHCQKPVVVPSSPSSDAEGDNLKTLPPSNRPAATAGITMAAEKPDTATEYDFLAPSQQPDELGRLGPYRVLKVLGAGGMGVVFRAEDPKLKRLVALKAMLPSMASSGSAKERFLREAQAAAAIKHDHIVAIYQVDEDRGSPFLAMEFLEGEPLDERLKRDKALPLADVLRIGRETAEGLAAAHARGLVHRDIKPANIWLESTPASPGRQSGERVKILDFGLARAVQEETHLTQQGAVIGTPAYMAPEQAGASDIDHRADLFSLGCVLYEMSTGERPFKGRDTISILMALASHEPPPPAELNPKVPAALSDLTMKLLAKEPENRPASAQEVVEALRDLEKDLPAHGERRGQTSARHQGQSKKPLVLAGIAVALLALAGVAALFLFRVSTPEGDFYVEVKDDEVAVAVNKHGGLTLIDRNGKKYSILARKTTKLPAGDYDVVLADGSGLEISGQTVTIKAKDSPASVTVWFKKNEIAGKKESPGLPEISDTFSELRQMPTSAPVRAIAFSRDSTLVLAGDAGLLRLWNIKTGKEEASWQAHEANKDSAKKDNKEGSKVDAAEPDPSQSGAAVTSICFSPTQENVAVSCGTDLQARLWDLRTQKPIRSYANATQADFSPDGKHLLLVHLKQMRVVEVSSGKEVYSYEAPDTHFLGAKFGSDRLVLHTQYRGPLMLHDWKENKVVHTFFREDQAMAIAIPPGGRKALTAHNMKPNGAWQGRVRLWDLDDPSKPPKVFEGHSVNVVSCAISDDGSRGLSGGWDGSMRVWDLKGGKEMHCFQVIPKPQNASYIYSIHCALSPDGRYAACGSNKKLLQLWRLPDTTDAKPKQVTKAPEPPAEPVGEVRRIPVPVPIMSMAPIPDSSLVLCGDIDGMLSLWNYHTGKEEARWKAHEKLDTASGKKKTALSKGSIWAVRVSPTNPGQALTCSYDGTLRLWDIAKRAEIRKLLDVSGDAIRSADFCANGKVAVCGTFARSSADPGNQPYHLRLIDVQSGKILADIESPNGIGSTAFIDDRLLLYGGSKLPLTLWDTTTKKSAFTFRCEDTEVASIAVSPDRQFALVGYADAAGKGTETGRMCSVRVWDLRDNTRAPKKLGYHTGRISDVAISPDGRRALSCCLNGEIILWDLTTAKEAHRFDVKIGATKSSAKAVVFSSDGRYALSGSNSNFLQVWRLPEPSGPAGKKIATSPDTSGKNQPPVPAESVGEVRRMLHPGTVKSVAYFADGKRVLTADALGTLRVWNVHTGVEEASWEAPPAGGSAYLHVRCSPTDANVAYSFRSGSLVIWDIAKRKPLHVCQIDGEKPEWGRGNFSADGGLIAVGGTKLWIFDVATGKQVHAHDPKRSTCRSPAFAGNDGILLGATENLYSFVLWDWRKNKIIQRFPSSAPVGTIATSRDGRSALSGHEDGKVWLWNMQDTTRPPVLLEGHEGHAYTVAVSADGRRGLSGGQDGIVLVHDLDQGKTIHRFDVKAGLGGKFGVASVAFSPDGRYAISGSSNSFLQLWRLPEPETAAPPIGKEKAPA